MKSSLLIALSLWFLIPSGAQAQENCPEMLVWNYPSGMCMPFPMPGMPMQMLMVQGNSFFMQTVESGPRGRSAFSIPDMLMTDIGSTVGDRQYLNLDLMATTELWTFPDTGTPELLQIGEDQSNGQPFLDAQHPHSSPIMGLTLSDAIALGRSQDELKLWLAPRGESTDGPIAFMHRPTGIVNPDAPLGHHIGQDVGHISGSVIGASTRVSNTSLELSTFNGTEPSPTAVELPIASPNSYAARLTQQFSANLYAMTSVAFVKFPEPDQPTLDHVWRYSASLYYETDFASGWHADGALIWGLINGYDNASALNSFAEEFLFRKNASSVWGRLEELQRSPSELEMVGVNNVNDGRWVEALTAGYTQKICSWENIDMGLGGSVTIDFLPAEYSATYGGNPFSGKVFLQLSGMKMRDL